MHPEVRKYMSELAAKSRALNTPAQQAASRSNGAKGGRPRLDGKPPIPRKGVQP